MKERPILFSAPMVKALLAGQKSQTRRLVTSPLAKAQPGDLLWVRETWHPQGQVSGGPIYAADNDDTPDWIDGEPVRGCRANWRSPLHMPRWASRITLRVTDVRRQHLQEISEEDAAAEGVEPYAMSRRGAFFALWNSLHTKPGTRWGDNPEVIAISFMREAP